MSISTDRYIFTHAFSYENKISSKIVLEELNHLKPGILDKKKRKEFSEILEIVSALYEQWEDLSKSGRKRLAARGAFSAALQILVAVEAERIGGIRAIVDALATEVGGLAPESFLTGSDLIALGFAPGPRFKTLLDRMYDLQLEGKLMSKEAAIALARTEWTA